MRKSNAIRRGLALGCALLAGTASLPAVAGDDAGNAARLQTLRKEIGAAYEEAKRACAGQAGSARKACLAQARQVRDKDLGDAPSQVAASAGMDSVTTTRTVTRGTDSDTTLTTTTAGAAPSAASR